MDDNTYNDQNTKPVGAGANILSNTITQDQILPGVIHPRHLVVSPQTLGTTYYSDGTNFTALPIAVNGSLLDVVTGVPTWLTPGTSGQVLTITGGVPVWASPAAPSSPSGTLQAVHQVTIGNISTSSASYVDATGLTTTFTPASTCDLLIDVWLNWFNGSANGQNYAVILLDGAIISPDPTLALLSVPATNASQASAQFWYANVSTSSHTVKIQWKISAGAGATIWQSGGLIVKEFKH